MKNKIANICKKDSEFLMKNNIMDYSILITIEDLNYKIFKDDFNKIENRNRIISSD